MGMNIEVVGKTFYTVHLTNEDVEKVRKYIEDHKDNLPSFEMEKNICWAVDQLSFNCEIDLYSDGKANESDFYTDEINWSEFEDRTAEEILNSKCDEVLV